MRDVQPQAGLAQHLPEHQQQEHHPPVLHRAREVQFHAHAPGHRRPACVTASVSRYARMVARWLDSVLMENIARPASDSQQTNWSAAARGRRTAACSGPRPRCRPATPATSAAGRRCAPPAPRPRRRRGCTGAARRKRSAATAAVNTPQASRADGEMSSHSRTSSTGTSNSPSDCALRWVRIRSRTSSPSTQRASAGVTVVGAMCGVTPPILSQQR